MHLIYIVGSVAFIHSLFEPVPILRTDFHAARAETGATEKALAAVDQGGRRKMSVPLFMLPSLTL